ncbi:MAG: monothiol glutaredoxin, Grx4 family [Acidiferrobacteraceae bacterium]|nr:monothiol glutaredoxin, Grx4 family [Acidiferrobacteraceae bacterium]|tara:strand:- start:1304 stop:1618 length:315 start_codon:yes stop_codon:yes gene_type:complete
MGIEEKISKVIEENPIMLFMKGSPDFPQCGFSGRAVQILEACGAKFGSADVLMDQELREAIKAYSNWPTIPQLYIGGELVGGSDIMMEMYENGELKEKIDALNN